MPFYDYVYGTMDNLTDKLHESSLKKQEDEPEVVHLTHLTTLESIYHLRIVFASFSAKPYVTKWFMWLMWPVTMLSMSLTRIYGRTSVIERNKFQDIKMQTLAIPKYSFQVRIKIAFSNAYLPKKY